MGCPSSIPKTDVSQKTLLPAPQGQSSNQQPRNLPVNQTTPQPSNQPVAQTASTSVEPPKPATPPQPVKEQLPQAQGLAEDVEDSFGLLLCGAGESGKTTYIRQLKIKYLHGISQNERHQFVQTIRGNMIETIQQLLFWAERNDKEISSDYEEDAAAVSELNAHECEFTPQLAEKLKELWEDPAIQEAFQHKDETIIPDHMDYFFAKIDDLVMDDYVPSDDDVLRARIRSIGIDKVNLYLDGAPITIYDVGGQKNERSKWDQVMKSVAGVIFCLSLAEYDKPCFENQSLLRINDALEIFKEITHREIFKEAPFFLICNKYDMFVEKIQNTDSFVKVFPDYIGDPHDSKGCEDYIIQKFMEASNPPIETRPILVYTQSSLDSEQVVANTNKICKYIQTNYYED